MITMLSFLLQMDMSKRLSRHLQNADIIRIVKELDGDEQREAEATSDTERVGMLTKEFGNIDRVDNYLKIKLARISAFAKHEEGIIKSQLDTLKENKKKIQNELKKLPKDPSGDAVRTVYAGNIARIEAHEAHVREVLRKVQQFRKAIKECCVATIRSAAKIRFWA